MKDFFGSFEPCKGEGPGTGCAVSGCRDAGVTARSSQTTDTRLCAEHAEAFDAGRVTGSNVFGWEVVR